MNFISYKNNHIHTIITHENTLTQTNQNPCTSMGSLIHILILNYYNGIYKTIPKQYIEEDDAYILNLRRSPHFQSFPIRVLNEIKTHLVFQEKARFVSNSDSAHFHVVFCSSDSVFTFVYDWFICIDIISCVGEFVVHTCSRTSAKQSQMRTCVYFSMCLC